MSNLGLLSYSLILEFLFKPKGIVVTQRQYIKEMLQEFDLANCKSISTPMAEKLKLTSDMQASPTDSTL